MRSQILSLFVLLLCLVLAGCGAQAVSSPQPGELERYLQENPEAAERAGQEEPEGFDGPTELPGQDE